MSDFSIQKANFDKQKNELKKFADQPATCAEFKKFETSGGFFGLGDHNVTGEEANELVAKLQSCIAEINERDKNVIKEFGEVYKTFEILDQEYINAILISLKSAEKASQEAKDAQKDIDDIIKAQQRTIDKLKEFKNQVNSYKHLPDIDGLWVSVQQIDLGIEEMADSIGNYDDRIKKISSENRLLRSRISIAYMIAGGALALSALQFILTLTGIM